MEGIEPIIFPVVFLLLLLGCAYYDVKRKEVPDLFTSGLWLSAVPACLLGACAAGMDAVAFYAVAGLWFSLLYSMNAVALLGKRGAILLWGDVLGVPPFAAAIQALAAPPAFVLLSLMASLIISSLRKERTPLFPLLATVFCFAFCIYCRNMKV